MNTLFRIGSDLLDVDMLMDQQLMLGMQLTREWDREVPVSAQVDDWDSMWYNALDKAA